MKKLQKFAFKHKRLLSVCALAIMMISSFACAEEATTTTNGLSVDFNIAEMFQWANTIIESLMPTVYVVVGFSLGFLIINSLKRAFH